MKLSPHATAGVICIGEESGSLMENRNVSVKCLSCGEVVVHNPRQLTGCNCDPDAPFWVYIEKDGTVKGWSLAKWDTL